jgi:hypothetical protein
VQSLEAVAITASRVFKYDQNQETRAEEVSKINKLHEDYALHSPYLDGTVVEFFNVVADMMIKDHKFAKKQREHGIQDLAGMFAKIKDRKEKWQYHDLVNAERDALFTDLLALEKVVEQHIEART